MAIENHWAGAADPGIHNNKTFNLRMDYIHSKLASSSKESKCTVSHPWPQTVFQFGEYQVDSASSQEADPIQSAHWEMGQLQADFSEWVDLDQGLR